MTILLPILFSVVYELTRTKTKERDMRIPPNPWVDFSLVTLGAVLGAKLLAPALTGGSEEMLGMTLGALAGSRILRMGYGMLNSKTSQISQ